MYPPAPGALIPPDPKPHVTSPSRKQDRDNRRHVVHQPVISIARNAINIAGFNWSFPNVL